MLFYRTCDALIDLRLDDGYVAGPKYKQGELYRFLEHRVAIKANPIVGSGIDRVGATRARVEQGAWINAFDKHADKALELMGMTNCNNSTSPE